MQPKVKELFVSDGRVMVDGERCFHANHKRNVNKDPTILATWTSDPIVIRMRGYEAFRIAVEYGGLTVPHFTSWSSTINRVT